MKPSLELKKICKSFGGNVIYSDVSFVFNPGCYVLTGQNGIGKSVLLEILAGVLMQDSGSVVMNGCNDSFTLDYKKNLTYIPSKPAFFPSATGEEFLSFIYSVKKKNINEELYRNLTEGFRLADFLHIKFNDMSLGSQKKLFLTTLAMTDGGLIIMDEPNNALDDQSNKVLTELIVELSKNNIVVIATHDKSLIRDINPMILELMSTPISNFNIRKVEYA